MSRAPKPAEPLALRGMEEAERQIRVAQRLYAVSSAAKPWTKLQVQDRRRWIDRSCDAEHRDLTE